MPLVTGEVRLHFVRIIEPDEKGRRSLCLLIPKEDEDTLDKITSAIEQAAELGKDKFGGKVPKNLKNPLHDGDAERDTDEYPEFGDVMYLNVSTYRPVVLVDADSEPILDPSLVYSGSYGRVALEFSTYNTDGSKGVSARFSAIQKTRDGERLGGGGSGDSVTAETAKSVFGSFTI